MIHILKYNAILISTYINDKRTKVSKHRRFDVECFVSAATKSEVDCFLEQLSRFHHTFLALQSDEHLEEGILFNPRIVENDITM